MARKAHCDLNSFRRLHSTSLSNVFRVKTLPRVAYSNFLISSRAYPKTPSTNTGNDLEFRLLWWLTRHTQCPEMLHACHFITGCAVIFSNLRFDNNLRIVLTWNDEIRRLIKTRYTCSAFGLPVTDPGALPVPPLLPTPYPHRPTPIPNRDGQQTGVQGSAHTTASRMARPILPEYEEYPGLLSYPLYPGDGSCPGQLWARLPTRVGRLFRSALSLVPLLPSLCQGV